MTVTKRLLGISLILVGGLAFVDWVLSFGLSGGSNQPILDFILYGELDTSGSEPILFTFGRWLCPGNGYAAFCEPLGWILFLLGALAVVACLLVNLTRGILKKCVNSQAVYPLSEKHGLKAQERRYTAHEEGKH